MEPVLYWMARALLALIDRLPLTAVARLGRLGGALAWHVDRRHRSTALENLAIAFGTSLTPAQQRAIAREHFRRLGENYACGLRTAPMGVDTLRPYLRWTGVTPFSTPGTDRVVLAVGHFGNFELLAKLCHFAPGWTAVTTYRALRPRAIDDLFQKRRGTTGVVYVERRHGMAALREAMRKPLSALGLLADQNAGPRGVPGRFFGRLCSCSPAPALFALRYNAPVHMAFCRRTRLAHWEIELGASIPTRHPDGRRRTLEEITADIQAEFEREVRRDPANWFWVHRRWKCDPTAASRRTPGETTPAEPEI